jgi:hypothetical protein
VILTALPLTTLTRMAQRAWQFKQEVTIHFSSGTPGFFLPRGWAEWLSNGPSILPAPTAAPLRADTFRNVLLSIVNFFGVNFSCSLFPDPNLPLFFIASTPKTLKNRSDVQTKMFVY